MDKRSTISIIDGLVRGMIFCITTELIYIDVLMEKIEWLIGLMIIGMIFSCISLCYATYINKDSIVKNIFFSLIGVILSLIICSCIGSNISQLYINDIGPGEGLILFFYSVILLSVTILCRGISIIIFYVKKRSV